MATPKLNNIIDQFTRRVGEPATYSGTTLQNGEMYDADEIVAFCTDAMHKLIEKFWMEIAGSVKLFAKIFPELVAPARTFNVSSGVYTIANPNLDFWKLYTANKSTGEFVQVFDNDLYSAIKADINENYNFTSDEPGITELGGKIYAFPDTLTDNIIVNFIKRPVLPTTGAQLVQDGSVDSPFYNHWNSLIADIAVEEWKRTNPRRN